MSSESIFRVTIAVEDYQELKLTGPALSVAPVRTGASDYIDLWFEHRDHPYVFGLYVMGTGHPVPWNAQTRDMFRFIGTVVTPVGLIWHVFTGPVK